jgi:hypothetical protein
LATAGRMRPRRNGGRAAVDGGVVVIAMVRR